MLLQGTLPVRIIDATYAGTNTLNLVDIGACILVIVLSLIPSQHPAG